MNGAELIAAERQRQESGEGWSAEHDENHDFGELVAAAIAYAGFDRMKHFFTRDPWPWESTWDKRGKHDQIRRLQIAGALLAAEIDRLQRLANQRQVVTEVD